MEREDELGMSAVSGDLGGPSGPRWADRLDVEFFLDGRGSPFEQWFVRLPPQAQTWADAKMLRLAESPRLWLNKDAKPLGRGLRELRHLGTGQAIGCT